MRPLQPLSDMSTRSSKIMYLGSRAWPVRRADNLTDIYKPIVLGNVGSLISHSPIGLHGLLWGQLRRTPYDVFEYHREYTYSRLKTIGLENVGASAFHKPLCLHGLLMC
jgi:hypothetical protein